jgi:hypothetical protein
MTQIRRVRRFATAGVLAITILALNTAGQDKALQTIFMDELFPPRVATEATETTVASKRTKDLIITIISAEDGLKGGERPFCVLFYKRGTDEPVEVEEVRVDFTLLVGRIHQQAIETTLTEDRVGRYCGHVNLGKQYYVPASYYAFVFYTDAAGRKKKERLFLSVR